MGLAISVGLLADLNVHDQDGAAHVRKRFQRLNKVLKANKLPSYTEPEELPKFANRARLRGFPYSFLHHLRRFAAHAHHNRHNPKWKPKPFPESAHAAADPVIADEQSMLDSHLLCHSDCDGFYVPVAFADPIFAAERDVSGGGMLGSSQGLMRELIEVAPSLKIKLSKGKLTSTEAGRINAFVRDEGPFWIEHAVWLALFEAARLSVEHQTAICFT